MYQLDVTTRIAAPANEVFAFFSDAGNLARITPPWLRFRVHGEAPREMAPGVRIEYRIRWLVFVLAWVTRITRFDPPREFQDVQEKGPYRSWIHTHTFEAGPGGAGVTMRDRVEYALPFGFLGRIAHAIVVRRQLAGIFEYRRRAIEEIFGRPGAAE